MTDKRSTQEEIEKLKRSNRNRLIGASVMVLLTGILLGKAFSTDSRNEEKPQVDIAVGQAASEVAEAAEPPIAVSSAGAENEAETQAAERLETVPIDRLSDEELQRILTEDEARNGRTPPAPEKHLEGTMAEGNDAPVIVSFPKAETENVAKEETRPAAKSGGAEADERRLKEAKDRAEAKRSEEKRKAAEARRQEEREAQRRKAAEEQKNAGKKQAEARENERKKAEERRLKEQAANAKAELKKRAEERKAAAQAGERKESKLAEAERRAAELRKQAAEAERRAAELKKQAEAKRKPEDRKAAADKGKAGQNADKDRKANIQAGAFRDAEHARQMKKRLNDAGIVADITVVNTDQGKVYRVRTGSYPNKEAAERALGRLKEKGINGRLVEKQ